VEKGNGMFRKGTLVAEDWRAQPLQFSAVTRSSAMLHPLATISSIDFEMAVVGKISESSTSQAWAQVLVAFDDQRGL